MVLYMMMYQGCFDYYLKSLQEELLQEDDDRLWMVSQYEYLPTTEKYATDLYYYDTYTNQMYPTLEKTHSFVKIYLRRYC